MTQPVYKTEEVAAFVEKYSDVQEGVELSKAKHTFRDGTVIARRDVFKKIWQLLDSKTDAESTKQLQSFSGGQYDVSNALPIKSEALSEEDKIAMKTLIEELPRFSRAVFFALMRRMYAEPGFSDVITQDLATDLNVQEQQVKGAISRLTRDGLVYSDEINDMTFQHAKLHTLGGKLSDLDYTDEVIDDHIKYPQKATTEFTVKPETKEPTMPTDTEQETSNAQIQETEAVDVPASDAKPKREKKVKEPKAAKPPKEPKAPRELTDDEKDALKDYSERYGKDKEGNEINLAEQSKGGAKSKISLEGRARMSLAAKRRWEDKAKREALQAAMKRKPQPEAETKTDEAAE